MDDQRHIAQGENVQGPFSRDQLQRYVAAGRPKPELYYSRNDGDWVQGYELPESSTSAACRCHRSARLDGGA